MSDPIQVGTVGLKLRVTMLDDGEAYDPSTASYREITITRPGTTPLVVSGGTVAVTVDSQGRPCLQYTTASAEDLPNPGPYKVQGFVRDAAGEWPTSVGRFSARANIRTAA